MPVRESCEFMGLALAICAGDINADGLINVSDIADESLGGTRVRQEAVTVETVPDADGVWTVTDATGTVTPIGMDTSDPHMNEDPDGP